MLNLILNSIYLLKKMMSLSFHNHLILNLLYLDALIFLTLIFLLNNLFLMMEGLLIFLLRNKNYLIYINIHLKLILLQVYIINDNF